MTEQLPDEATSPYHRIRGVADAHTNAVALIEAEALQGVALDLGCGYGLVAEPLRDLGLDYLGLDSDPGGVDDLRDRGFEAHVVDLESDATALAKRLEECLAGRPLGAVLALDVLEHLTHPEAVVEAVTRLARSHPAARFVVSLPNITHVDVVGKLLLGRWDLRANGLLDRTHLRFFDHDAAVGLLTAGGWEATGSADVKADITEQCDPADAPQLRPGSPLNDFLRLIRSSSEGSATTFQFVRTYRLVGDGAMSSRGASEADGSERAATVVVLPGASGLDAIGRQLGAQVERDFDVVLVTPPPGFEVDAFAVLAGISPARVRIVEALADLDRAIRGAGGRYLCSIGPGDSVAADWLQQFADAFERAPGRVLVASCSGEDGQPLPVARFDLVAQGATGAVPAVAYAVPRGAVLAGVLSWNGSDAARAASLARATMWCGRHDLLHVTATSRAPLTLEELHEDFQRELAGEPLLLAPGAAAPLLLLHGSVGQLQARAEQAEAARHQLQVDLELYTAASEAERDALQRRLAMALPERSLAWRVLRRATAAIRTRVRPSG